MSELNPDTICIWWLSQADMEAIGEPADVWPDYLCVQYQSRRGRAGRGRLWVADEFPVTAIPWLDTPLGRLFSGDYGGIVMYRADLAHLFNLPGYVTDIGLHLLGGRVTPSWHG